MSWFEKLFINEAKAAIHRRPTSWDDVVDKPFGETSYDITVVPDVEHPENSLVNDSHIDNPIIVRSTNEAVDNCMMKVSNHTFPRDNIPETLVTLISDGEVLLEAPLSESDMQWKGDILVLSEFGMVVYSDGATYGSGDDIMTYPEAGLYVECCVDLTYRIRWTEVKTIDPKFIPNSI